MTNHETRFLQLAGCGLVRQLVAILGTFPNDIGGDDHSRTRRVAFRTRFSTRYRRSKRSTRAVHTHVRKLVRVSRREGTPGGVPTFGKSTESNLFPIWTNGCAHPDASRVPPVAEPRRFLVGGHFRWYRDNAFTPPRHDSRPKRTRNANQRGTSAHKSSRGKGNQRAFSREIPASHRIAFPHASRPTADRTVPTVYSYTQFHLLKHNPYLQQYHLAALAPFLTSQAQAAVSPRRDAEEELALLALQAMKHPSPGGDRRGTTKSGVTRVTGA